jgi:uncharacterized membrane protein
LKTNKGYCGIRTLREVMMVVLVVVLVAYLMLLFTVLKTNKGNCGISMLRAVMMSGLSGCVGGVGDVFLYHFENKQRLPWYTHAKSSDDEWS